MSAAAAARPRGALRDVARRVVLHARRNDAKSRSKLLLAIHRWLHPEVRLPDPGLDGYRDLTFVAYLARFGELAAFNAPRRWNLHHLLRLSLAVPGDTAECGVFDGAGSWLICQATRGSGKRHHVFDSFAGLSEPGAGDGDHWRAGDLARPLERVRENLAGFDDVAYHPGWIPERSPPPPAPLDSAVD